MRLATIGTGLAAGGSLFSLELDGQVAFAERFALRMRAPVHWLRHGRNEQSGPGDLTLGAEALFTLGRLRLGLGTDVELPTGDADVGLGHGAITLAPQATAQLEIAGGLRALAQSSLLVDLTDPPADVVDPVEQQDEVELRAAGGAMWQRGPVSAAGLVRLSLPLSSDDGAGYATGVVVGELTLGPHLRGSLFAEVPLGGDRRIDWRAGLAVAYRFAN